MKSLPFILSIGISAPLSPRSQNGLAPRGVPYQSAHLEGLSEFFRRTCGLYVCLVCAEWILLALISCKVYGQKAAETEQDDFRGSPFTTVSDFCAFAALHVKQIFIAAFYLPGPSFPSLWNFLCRSFRLPSLSFIFLLLSISLLEEMKYFCM